LPAHAILAGVNSFTIADPVYYSQVSLVSGATQVAHWNNGYPLVVTKPRDLGRVVALNAFPWSTDGRSDGWNPSSDGAQLVANALLWSANASPGTPIQTVSVDFNTPGQLTGLFNDGYSSPAWSQNTSVGLSGSGGVTIPDGTSDLYISKQAFPLEVGATYTVGAYYYNHYNSGYGGLGFTTLTSGTINGGNATPLSGIGVSFHGGGGFMDNNDASASATTSVNWDTAVAGDYWFYFKVTLTCTSANTFNQTMEIWQCDANGTLGTKFTTTTVTGQVNATVGAASMVYPFLGASMSRFTAVDSFTATTTVTTTTIQPRINRETCVGIGAMVCPCARALSTCRPRRLRNSPL